MTERHGELTRYLTFKLDEYVAFLAPHLRNVLNEIAKEPEGITFEDLLASVNYKGRWMGPRLLKASLKHLTYDEMRLRVSCKVCSVEASQSHHN